MKIKDIKNWFEIAIPEPTKEQACVQVGCHVEEFGEMMSPIGHLTFAKTIHSFGRSYKACDTAMLSVIKNLTDEDKIELLDSLADQIVTAIGVAHTLGMDIEGALEEVNRSNHSKFEDGKAVFDENGKITKGKNYTKPDLKPYI